MQVTSQYGVIDLTVKECGLSQLRKLEVRGPKTLETYHGREYALSNHNISYLDRTPPNVYFERNKLKSRVSLTQDREFPKLVNTSASSQAYRRYALEHGALHQRVDRAGW